MEDGGMGSMVGWTKDKGGKGSPSIQCVVMQAHDSDKEQKCSLICEATSHTGAHPSISVVVLHSRRMKWTSSVVKSNAFCFLP